jgi:transcriptional regulator with XRE-family HTH domain
MTFYRIIKGGKRGKTAQSEPKTGYQYYRMISEDNGRKITQEQAAHRLGISLRQFSDYETGKAPVPADIVVAMVKYYRQPNLLLWHLKYKTPYGELLPDVADIETPQDIIFANTMNQKKHIELSETLVRIMEDMKITDDEIEDTDRCIEKIMNMISFSFSTRTCLEQMKSANAQTAKKDRPALAGAGRSKNSNRAFN